jgi:hypothetical protein
MAMTLLNPKPCYVTELNFGLSTPQKWRPFRTAEEPVGFCKTVEWGLPKE